MSEDRYDADDITTGVAEQLTKAPEALAIETLVITATTTEVDLDIALDAPLKAEPVFNRSLNGTIDTVTTPAQSVYDLHTMANSAIDSVVDGLLLSMCTPDGEGVIPNPPFTRSVDERQSVTQMPATHYEDDIREQLLEAERDDPDDSESDMADEDDDLEVAGSAYEDEPEIDSAEGADAVEGVLGNEE